MLFAYLKLLIRRSRCNDSRTHYFTYLDCRETYTSCCSKYQQCFAWMKLCSILKRMMRCSVCQQKSRSSSKVQSVGHRDYVGCISNGLLSKTSHTDKGHYPRSNVESIYSLTQLFNNTCDLAARYKGKWWFRLVFSLNDQSIWEVHTTCFHTNYHLAFPRFEWVNLFNDKALWRPKSLT